MKKFAKYLFLPFILFFIFSCDLLKDKNNYYYSKNGEIDLTSWNCEKDEIISLNGEWEFYPNSFLYSNDFLEKDFNNKKILINVPSVWNESKINNKNIRPFGFATYRIVLKLKENCLIYGIKIPDMSSSYKFFVNNKLVSSSGNPADNKKDERVKFSPDFTFIQLNDGDQIIIQVSNHVLLNGGIWKSIEIGSVKKMKENRLKSIFLDSLFIGGFLFIGLYYLLFFLIRKNDKFYLYFSLFCIIVSLRTLIISNSLIFLVFPSFSGIIALKLEYLTIFIGFPIYFLYNYYIYKKYLNNIVKKIFQFSGIVLTIIVALTDITFSHVLIKLYHIVLILVPSYIIFCLIKAVRNKEIGALFIVIGNIVLYISVFLDVIFNYKYYFTLFTPIGLFIFVCLQSSILSFRFSKAYNDIEFLTRQIKSKQKDLLIRRQQIYNKNRLTEKEIEVCEIAIQGKSNKEIGEILFKSDKTIEVQLTSIYNKFKISKTKDKKIALINILKE